MDHKANNHHDHTGNGFLVGVIIGGVATLLFTTKKGREIVKDLTSKSLDKFSEIQKNLDETVDFEEVDGGDYVEPEDRPAKLVEEKEQKLLASDSGDKSKKSSESEKHNAKSSVRRFFKSSKKN